MSDLYLPRKAWRVAVMLFLFMAINFMDKISIGLLAVPMMNELNLTPAQFGLIGSSFYWLFAVAGIAGGFLADRRPSTLLLLGMAVLWTVCQLPLALSSSLAALIATRVLLGIGEGPAFPVAAHACYKWFPDDKRNMPVALLSLGAAVGLLVAGIVVPLISARWGWRANFYVLALLTAAWALAWLAIGREGPISATPQQDSAQRRVPYRRLLTDPTVFACMLMRFAAYWGLALTLTWLPAYLQRGLGFDASTAGKVYALMILATIPVALLLPWYSQRLLARGVSSRAGRGLLSAFTLVAGGLMFMSVLSSTMPTTVRVVALAIGLGLVPVIYTLGPAMLAQVVPGRQRGAVIAIDNSVASVAGALAPVVTGLLIQHAGGTRGYEWGFALCGLFMVAGGCIAAFIVRPERSAHGLAAAAAG